MEKVLEKEKTKITLKDIYLRETGELNEQREWIWDGNYEMVLYCRYYPIQYDFYASFKRKCSPKKHTTGWHVCLYVGCIYKKGRDIKILDKSVQTLKKAKQIIFEAIQDVHNNEIETKKIIENWKE